MNNRQIIFFLSVALFFAGCTSKSGRNNKHSKTHDNVINSANHTKEGSKIAGEEIFDCPPEGNAQQEILQELNVLKNRSNIPDVKDFDMNVSLQTLLNKGDDTYRWNVKSAAKITGYVRDVKPGSIETANCKSKDLISRDTHIELVQNPMSAEKNESVIVEITPRLRKIMAAKGEDWSTSMIRSKYLGRWVEIEGWLLFDFEHTDMAENTHPGNPKNWRATAWEVHPITSIKTSDKH